MAINFIPGWASNPKNESFFQFPRGGHRESFAKEIATVRPHYEAWERPALEDKFYGYRRLGGREFIVCQELLFDFASKEENGKRVMRNIEKLTCERIVDGAIRRAVQGFFKDNPICTVERWRKFCEEELRVGKDGPQVIKVMMTRSKAEKTEEYGPIGKTSSTQRQHAGYYIYTIPAPTRADPVARDAKAMPVFAHQRCKNVEAEVKAIPGVKVVGYFWSNCRVRIAEEWEFKGTLYPADEYILKTAWEDGRAVLKHAVHGSIGKRPKHNAPVPVRLLVQHGLIAI